VQAELDEKVNMSLGDMFKLVRANFGVGAVGRTAVYEMMRADKKPVKKRNVHAVAEAHRAQRVNWCKAMLSRINAWHGLQSGHRRRLMFKQSPVAAHDAINPHNIVFQDETVLQMQVKQCPQNTRAWIPKGKSRKEAIQDEPRLREAMQAPTKQGSPCIMVSGLWHLDKGPISSLVDIPPGLKINSAVWQEHFGARILPDLYIHAGEQFKCIIDNAPSHRSHSSIEYYKATLPEGAHIIFQPSASPDLNMLDITAWDRLKTGLRAHFPNNEHGRVCLRRDANIEWMKMQTEGEYIEKSRIGWYKRLRRCIALEGFNVELDV
jgi:hypothetical protein